MKERRKHLRIVALHPVLYYSNAYPRPKVASTLDISLGGARIETRSPLMNREELDISIAIHPNVIKCRGRVVYVIDSEDRRIRAGIQFEGLTQEDRSSLERFLFSLTDL